MATTKVISAYECSLMPLANEEIFLIDTMGYMDSHLSFADKEISKLIS